MWCVGYRLRVVDYRLQFRVVYITGYRLGVGDYMSQFRLSRLHATD